MPCLENQVIFNGKEGKDVKIEFIREGDIWEGEKCGENYLVEDLANISKLERGNLREREGKEIIMEDFSGIEVGEIPCLKN